MQKILLRLTISKVKWNYKIFKGQRKESKEGQVFVVRIQDLLKQSEKYFPQKRKIT